MSRLSAISGGYGKRQLQSPSSALRAKVGDAYHLRDFTGDFWGQNMFTIGRALLFCPRSSVGSGAVPLIYLS
ncbi:Protein CBG26274 [Caenorhabditis briggsae]|uniref:Protein CBG26274 n=1 Tax=Caenorhabditis briggsae TaxID=6238 RepID=B6IJH9_CAEBR|nr:Protein CBG26274 [Caenorhabditis briggsae]CAS00059.1 Protein CBG26274 [Caenorhabditis briggsae]